MKEQDAQAKLSLKLQAYQYLKTKILNCEYRPNEFLNEQKLCAEMGNISRTPILTGPCDAKGASCKGSPFCVLRPLAAKDSKNHTKPSLFCHNCPV